MLALLDDADTSEVCLTLKNYLKPKGLSTKIHESQPEKNEIFKVKGPMGLGLQIACNGVHVIFCAGTGILAFLDLVSTLLIVETCEQLNKQLPAEMEDRLGKDFRLHMHVSFRSEDESIGFDICKKLSMISNRFRLFIKDKQSCRWGQDYLDNSIQEAQKEGELKQIWVCGTPTLN